MSTRGKPRDGSAMSFSRSWGPRISRPRQADRIWRARARLFLCGADGRRARRDPLRRRADGDRRADRHGDAGARALRLRRAQARILGAVNFRAISSRASASAKSGAGSDVASIKTFARANGDDYVIDGGKMWTTNGAQADWMCLIANTSEGAPHRNKSLICLPMKTKGVTVARKLDKLGMRSSDTAQIFFDGVRVPKRFRIGEEGKGFVYQMMQFQQERLWAAASLLKANELIISDTIQYTRSEKRSGARSSTTRSSSSSSPNCRPRSNCCARWSIAPRKRSWPARTRRGWRRWPS